MKGATKRFHISVRPFCHFNPRTREGCDEQVQQLKPEFRISIHAPVKGATVRRMPAVLLAIISIHAPVKGATATVGLRRLAWQAISIHAPVKGATSQGDKVA